jgi:hypothetical protein
MLLLVVANGRTLDRGHNGQNDATAMVLRGTILLDRR